MIKVLCKWDLKEELGQLRVAPVSLGKGSHGLLMGYAPDFLIDPSPEMFVFPKGPMGLCVGLYDGIILWKKTLGKGVIPGVWFTPFLAFDLDKDGIDEIWILSNTDELHPLSWEGLRLQKISPMDGTLMEEYKWPFESKLYKEDMSSAYRHFLLCGYIKGEPVLVCGEGTYRFMELVAFNSSLSELWRWQFDPGRDHGPRGSHQTPVVDFNHDGVDEIIWGERIISIETGKEVLSLELGGYSGHADLVQPVWNEIQKSWQLFVIRESRPEFTPRVVCYGNDGKILWSDLEYGHIDQGMVFSDLEKKYAWAMRIEEKRSLRGGFVRFNKEEFLWEIDTGRSLPLNRSLYGCVPADLTGKGITDFLISGLQGTGTPAEILYVSRGNNIFTREKFSGIVAACFHIPVFPAEQIIVFLPHGSVQIIGLDESFITSEGERRYNRPAYKINSKLISTAYNIVNLGGL